MANESPGSAGADPTNHFFSRGLVYQVEKGIRFSAHLLLITDPRSNQRGTMKRVDGQLLFCKTETADEVGVADCTISAWLKAGIIPEPRHSAGSKRCYYTQAEIERIKAIARDREPEARRAAGYFTISEVRRRVKVSRPTFDAWLRYRWVPKPHTKYRGKLRYVEADVIGIEAWIRARKAPAGWISSAVLAKRLDMALHGFLNWRLTHCPETGQRFVSKANRSGLFFSPEEAREICSKRRSSAKVRNRRCGDRPSGGSDTTRGTGDRELGNPLAPLGTDDHK